MAVNIQYILDWSCWCGLNFPGAESKCRLQLGKLPKLVILFPFLSLSFWVCGDEAADTPGDIVVFSFFFFNLSSRNVYRDCGWQ